MKGLGVQIRFQCPSKDPFDIHIMSTSDLLVPKIPLIESTYFPQEKNETINLVMTKDNLHIFWTCSRLYHGKKKVESKGSFFLFFSCPGLCLAGAYAGVNRSKS